MSAGKFSRLFERLEVFESASGSYGCGIGKAGADPSHNLVVHAARGVILFATFQILPGEHPACKTMECLARA
ncbi:MAG: hypothetical protein ACPIOQ_29230, partial [Promethearchaeia archaeon]